MDCAKRRTPLQQLECPVCQEVLTEPKALPCGHILCGAPPNDCLEKLKEKDGISCPLCKEHHSTLDKEFMPLYALREYLAELKSDQEENIYDVCCDHSRMINMYCANYSCVKAVCDECILESHDMHRIQHISVYYDDNCRRNLSYLREQRIVAMLKKSVSALNSRILDMDKLSLSYKSLISLLESKISRINLFQVEWENLEKEEKSQGKFSKQKRLHDNLKIVVDRYKDLDFPYENLPFDVPNANVFSRNSIPDSGDDVEKFNLQVVINWSQRKWTASYMDKKWFLWTITFSQVSSFSPTLSLTVKCRLTKGASAVSNEWTVSTHVAVTLKSAVSSLLCPDILRSWSSEFKSDAMETNLLDQDQKAPFRKSANYVRDGMTLAECEIEIVKREM